MLACKRGEKGNGVIMKMEMIISQKEDYFLIQLRQKTGIHPSMPACKYPSLRMMPLLMSIQDNQGAVKADCKLQKSREKGNRQGST